MPLDSSDVRVASDGRIYVGNVGVAAPAFGIAPATADWSDLGYASEDGVSLSPSLDTDEINAWQSAVPVRRIVTGSSLEIGFTLLQSNTVNLGLFFNATIVEEGVAPNQTYRLDIPIAPTPLERALLIEWKDGTETFRLYVPKAALSETGEATLARGDAVGLEMTFTALPPATGANLAQLYAPTAAAA